MLVALPGNRLPGPVQENGVAFLSEHASGTTARPGFRKRRGKLIGLVDDCHAVRVHSDGPLEGVVDRRGKRDG